MEREWPRESSPGSMGMARPQAAYSRRVLTDHSTSGRDCGLWALASWLSYGFKVTFTYTALINILRSINY